MLDAVSGASASVEIADSGNRHAYVVQAVSYVGFSDNVSPENCVKNNE